MELSDRTEQILAAHDSLPAMKSASRPAKASLESDDEGLVIAEIGR
jgi:hypothetical protein